MKKVLVIALAVVMALAVVAFVACEQPQTVTGKCHYSTQYGAYGAMVDVTVKGDVITSVKLYTDAEAAAADENWNDAHRTTLKWTATEGQLGFEATEAAYEDWLADVFVGKTVAEVNAYKASVNADGQSVTPEGVNLKGATQSAARVIVAVQNALSKLPA